MNVQCKGSQYYDTLTTSSSSSFDRLCSKFFVGWLLIRWTCDQHWSTVQRTYDNNGFENCWIVSYVGLSSNELAMDIGWLYDKPMMVMDVEIGLFLSKFVVSFSLLWHTYDRHVWIVWWTYVAISGPFRLSCDGRLFHSTYDGTIFFLTCDDYVAVKKGCRIHCTWDVFATKNSLVNCHKMGPMN